MSVQNLKPVIVSSLLDPYVLTDSLLDQGPNLEEFDTALREYYTSYFEKTSIKSLTGSSLISFLCFGEFPFLLHQLSKGVTFTAELFDELRKRLDRLTDEERDFVLEQLPEKVRKPLEKNWKKPCSMRVVQAAAKAATSVTRGLAYVGKKCLSFALPLAGKACKKLLSPVVSEETQDHLIEAAGRVGRMMARDTASFIRKLGYKAISYALHDLHHDINVLFQQFLNSKVGSETIEQLEKSFNELTPRKAARILFSSLKEFCRTHHEIASDGKLDPKNSASVLLALRHAAHKNRLPTVEMNRGLGSLLENGISPEEIAEQFHILLDDVLLDVDAPFPEEDFLEFCKQNNLEMAPRECLSLIRKAFYIKNCMGGVSPETVYLAELVLLDLKRALVLSDKIPLVTLVVCQDSPSVKKRAAALLQEHFAKEGFFPTSNQEAEALELHYFCLAALEDNPTPEERRKILSLMSIADGILQNLFSPQNLMETVVLHHVKNRLGPVILQKCLSDEGRLWLRILGKLTGQNIEDKICLLLAKAFVKNGLATLKDTHAVSKMVLKLFKAPTEHLDEYQIAHGKDPFNAEEFEIRPSHRRKIELSYQAEDEMQSQFAQAASNLSFGKRFFLGSTVSAMGKDIADLTKRADWGLWLLHFSDRLAEGISHPEEIEPLYLSNPDNRGSIQMVTSDLLPAMGWVTSYSAFTGYLETGDKSLEEYNYNDSLQGVRNRLLERRVVARVMAVMGNSRLSPALVREKIASSINEHVETMLKEIWGIDSKHPKAKFVKERYMQFLLMADSDQLLRLVQTSSEYIDAIRFLLLHLSDQAYQNEGVKLEKMTAQADRLEEEIGRKLEKINTFIELEAELDRATDDSQSGATDDVRIHDVTKDMETIPIQVLRREILALERTRANLLRRIKVSEERTASLFEERSLLKSMSQLPN